MLIKVREIIMKFHKVCFLSVVLFLAGVLLWGQSNELIDQFLEKESADLQTTLLLLAQSMDELSVSASPADAMFWAESQSWNKYIASLSPEDPVSLGRYFAILFRTYDIKGESLMYNIFKTPRYAAMEAYKRGFCPAPLYHTRAMTPPEVLDGLSMIMEVSGE